MIERAQLAALLQRYLSPIVADSILSRALRGAGVLSDQVPESALDAVASRLDTGIRLFLEPSDQIKLRAALEALGGPKAAGLVHVIAVRQEDDISEARLRARALCDSVNARSLLRQRAAIIVSELARNIVSYTPGGSVELSLLDRPRRLRILAVDSGSGIREIDKVLAGTYQSRTGMGKGISGVRKIADRFDLKTDTEGTRIEVEVLL